MVFEQVLSLGDDLGAKGNGQNGKYAEANQTSNNDGQQEVRQAHLKDACGEDKQLERRWRRQSGGKHQCQELLAFEAVADALELGFVNAFEQEQLTAGAAQIVRQQATHSGTQGAGDAIKP